ncbi:ABC transporter permease [Actinomycetaceae bacterium TAE3-ERU4]|nr:ABC transporter permease [Actinomycetaceae bacterium TAE3-ERU4]
MRRILVSLSGITSLILLWQLLALMMHNESLLPSPFSVFSRLTTDFGNQIFWQETWITFSEALLGCLFGSFLALPLAYLIYKNRVFAAAFEPILAISQSIPAVALAPLLAVWVGYGLIAISALCALIVFFPILVTTVLGLRSLPREILEAARLDGAGGINLLALVEFPMAFPAVLSGLRAGFTLSVTGAVVGEFVMGGQGLGARLSLESANSDMAGLFSTILVLCSLAAFAFSGISFIERHSSDANELRMWEG